MAQTLEEAKSWLRDRVKDGARCPCCTRFAKVYQRKITSSMARMLIRIYRADPSLGFVYLPDLRDGNGAMDTTMTQFWGLIEEERVRRDDGGRAGFWRLTLKGEAFVLGRLCVPTHAWVYDGRCLQLVGDPISIEDCLGRGFNYRELMGG